MACLRQPACAVLECRTSFDRIIYDTFCKWLQPKLALEHGELVAMAVGRMDALQACRPAWPELSGCSMYATTVHFMQYLHSL